MNYQEYIALLKTQTSTLNYNSQLKFAILICKKLFFHYQKFYEQYNWGNPDLLMDAILICEKAVDNSINTEELKILLIKINEITPHMDDYGDEIASYALNASASVYETLEYIIDKDTIHIYKIGTYYTDTIDFQIQEERTLTQQEIENHPLMIEAWNFIIEQTKET